MKLKFNKQKVAKWSLRIGTGVAALLVGLVPAYALTPSRTNVIDLSENSDPAEDPSQPAQESHFNEFVAKYVGSIDDGLGLTATFENFTVSFPGKTELRNNVITLGSDSSIQVMMEGLDNIDFKAELNVNYNERELAVSAAYTGNEDLYVRVKDLGLKFTDTTRDQVVPIIEECFYEALNIDPNATGPIDFTIKNPFDFDLSSIISGFMGGSGSAEPSETGLDFKILPDEAIAGGRLFKFVLINKYRVYDVEDDPATEQDDSVSHIDTDYMGIHITTDNDYNIEKINLCPDGSYTDGNNVEHPYIEGLKFGDITIKGVVNTVIDRIVVNPPAETNSFHYIEVLNYRGWIDKLSRLLGTERRKMSFDFSAKLSSTKEVEDELHVKTDVPVDMGGIKGSIDLDASKLIQYYLAFYQNGYVEENNPDPALSSNLEISSENENAELIKRLANSINLGIDLQLYSADDDWDLAYGGSNLSIKYFNEAGYINLNEFTDSNTNEKNSVLKAKVDTSTINWMINHMGDTINNISDEVKYIITSITDKIHFDDDSDDEGFFDFITNSEVVSAIKEGEYAPILDLITTLSNNEADKIITLTLDLSKVGLGTGSTVSLVLDAHDDDSHHVLSLSAHNVDIKGIKMDIDLHTNVGRNVSLTAQEEATYQSLSFLPTLAEQIEGILGNRQVAFDVNATILDENGLGLEIDGDAQFDYGGNDVNHANKGFANLTIDQYKYHYKGEKDSGDNTIPAWYSHQLSLDIDNQSDDPYGNNVKFVYGDPTGSDNIKGYFTMGTIYDVADTIIALLNDEDERYDNIRDLFGTSAAAGGISDIIADKDYFRLAHPDFIQLVNQTNNGLDLEVRIGGDVLGLAGDINVVIHFKHVDNAYGDRELVGLELINFQMGEGADAKFINASLTLKDYDPDYNSPVPEGLEGFYDLQSISTLLEYGINTTKLNNYHLHADLRVNVNALGINIGLDLTVDVYIEVDGKKVKLYGTTGYDPDGFVALAGSSLIKDTPNWGILATKLDRVESEFTFVTNIDEYNDGGDPYIDIKKTYYTELLLTGANVGTFVEHYRATSSYLMDNDNVLYYLMDNLLHLDSAQIGDLAASGGEDEEKDPGNYTGLFSPYDSSDESYYGFGYTEEDDPLTDDVNEAGWHVGINLGNLLANDSLRNVEAIITHQTVGSGDDATTYLDSAWLSLKIVASIATITISGTITLTDIDIPWDQDMQNAFDALAGAAFPSSAIDNRTAYIED